MAFICVGWRLTFSRNTYMGDCLHSVSLWQQLYGFPACTEWDLGVFGTSRWFAPGGRGSVIGPQRGRGQTLRHHAQTFNRLHIKRTQTQPARTYTNTHLHTHTLTHLQDYYIAIAYSIPILLFSRHVNVTLYNSLWLYFTWTGNADSVPLRG